MPEQMNMHITAWGMVERVWSLAISEYAYFGFQRKPVEKLADFMAHLFQTCITISSPKTHNTWVMEELKAAQLRKVEST